MSYLPGYPRKQTRGRTIFEQAVENTHARNTEDLIGLQIRAYWILHTIWKKKKKKVKK